MVVGVLLWCGVVWCGVVWCGVVWCGVVWCGVVWCGGGRRVVGGWVLEGIGGFFVFLKESEADSQVIVEDV